jgi:hypothetical protein
MLQSSSRKFISALALAGAVAAFAASVDARAHGIGFAQRALPAAPKPW